MKKTTSPSRVLLVAFIVACVATAIIKVLEYTFGPAEVFLGALILIPIVFVWCVFTGETKRSRQAFKEREKAWRNNCDLSHRKVVKKTN
jgi:MFS-type transporter involved in bile tolerance (Atg22 family)